MTGTAHAFILLLLLLPCINGCLSPARSLEKEAIAQIRVAGSTRGEIEEQFGRPVEILVGSNHKTVAQYWFVMDSPPSALQQPRVYMRSLCLLYDRNGVVEKLVHHESEKTVDYKINAASIGAPVRTDQIIKGKTAANAFITTYGPPDFKSLTPDGELVFGWIYEKRQRGNEISSGAERFQMLVDANGIVTDFQIRAESVPRMSP